MKAKEYFIEYKKNQVEHGMSWEQSIIEQFNNMFNEVGKLRDQRKAKTDSAIIAIFNEMNQKANALCKMINKSEQRGLYHDAFKIYVAQRTPDFAILIGWG